MAKATATNAMRKPMPERIVLSESQRIGLGALAISDNAALEQLRQLQAVLANNAESRTKIHTEIGEKVGLTAEEIGNNYQSDGKEFFLPKK